MFFIFPVLIYTIIYFVGLEFAALADKEILILIFLMAVSTLFAFFSSKSLGKNFRHCTIPSIFAFSSFLLLYLASSKIEKQVLIILSSALYYFGLLAIYRLHEYENDQTARGLLAAYASAATFYHFTAIYGFYLNFAIPIWVLMLLFLAGATGISYQYLRFTGGKIKLVWSYSLVIGLAMAEIAWVINFWPFGYLTTGAITLMLYYVFWDLAQSYFLRTLSKKRVLANIVFFSVLIAMVLATSRWLPVV